MIKNCNDMIFSNFSNVTYFYEKMFSNLWDWGLDVASSVQIFYFRWSHVVMAKFEKIRNLKEHGKIQILNETLEKFKYNLNHFWFESRNSGLCITRFFKRDLSGFI